ncbi:MAG: hypothetical protein IJZ13_01340, partial [Clostridia bacterium]|nr:hypothetical protein [Clostridia bacterium]
MKGKHTWFLRAAGIALTFVLLAGIPAVAQTVAYESYTYNYGTGEAEAAASPHPYLPQTEISLKERYEVGSLADFCRDDAGNWYIADSGKSRILLLDAAFSLYRTIETFGEGDRFSSPEGLCLLPDGRICVADTGNQRLVILTREGELSSLFTAEGQAGVRSTFQPVRVGAGHDGQIYVISRNDYTGILELDEQGSFLGYL